MGLYKQKDKKWLMDIGDRVIVMSPPWRDATGRVYPAGRHHGEIGIVTKINTNDRVGNDYLIGVLFPPNGRYDLHWHSELRRAPPNHHMERTVGETTSLEELSTPEGDPALGR